MKGLEITVVSFNIRLEIERDLGVTNWQARRAAVVDYLNQMQARVVCLQEVMPSQFEYIKENLADKWQIVWYARDDANPEGLAIIFDKTFFSIVDQGVFWISETPFVHSKGWDARYYRICVAAKLLHKNTNTVIEIFNLHLDNRSQIARSEGIKTVMEIAKESSVPHVITGDFNSTNTSECYQTISAKMQDCQSVVGGGDGTFTFNRWGEIESGESPIDFCFASKEIEPIGFEILNKDRWSGNLYSDHFAIKATLIVPTKK